MLEKELDKIHDFQKAKVRCLLMPIFWNLLNHSALRHPNSPDESVMQRKT
jgi:hypothetical protein